MARHFAWRIAAGGLALAACASAGPRGAVFETASITRSHVDRVFVVLESEEPLRSARLRVDGEPWGRFEPAEPGRRVLLSASPEAGNLRTAGDWVSFLGRDLPPGGHVMEVVDVESVSGRSVAVNRFVSFDIEEGQVTGYAGTVVVTPEVSP